MGKKIIAVIFGGNSTEYEVSLQSASSVFENINKDKFEIVPIGITRNGDWYHYTGKTERIANNTWIEDSKNLHSVVVSQNRSVKGFLELRRGDIYYADLNPVIGSEQGGTRPVLIISNDTGNKYSPTVIIAAITSRVHTKAKLPTHTAIKDFEGLSKDSVILLEQIRTIDKKRLREHIGMLDSQQILTADNALLISLGLDKKD